MTDLDDKLIFEAYTNNLLLEQLLNPKEMLSDIENLFSGGDATMVIRYLPVKFKNALGKMAAKSILQWLNSEPEQDYYDTNFDYLSNTQLKEFSERFQNIGKTLNNLKREGEWAWNDDEEKKKNFEQKYKMPHPRNLPDWMYEEGTTKLREDLYKYFSYKLLRADLRDKVADEIYSLWNSILSKYNSDEWPYSDHLMHFIDFLTDYRLNERIAQKSGIRYAHSREGVYEYFFKQPVEQRLIKMSRDYDKVLKAIAGPKDLENAKKIYDDPKKARLIKDYGNGWKWFQLLDNEACQISGDLMDHCVGGYDPLHPSSRILQLVGPDGDGHATIQLTIDERLEGPVNEVAQIKGKKNSRLKPEYESMVKDLLTSYKVKPLTTIFRSQLTKNGEIKELSVPVKQPNDYSYK